MCKAFVRLRGKHVAGSHTTREKSTTHTHTKRERERDKEREENMSTAAPGRLGMKPSRFVVARDEK